MLRILHDTKFDFIKWWRWAAGLTAAFILLGLASFVIRGGVNYSIEFTGGTLMQLQFAKATDVGRIRSTMDRAGITGAEIQTFGSDSGFTIRAQNRQEVASQAAGAESVAQRVQDALTKEFGSNTYRVVRTEAVGPRVGAELRRNAAIAMLLASLVTLVYLAIRFEWRFGLAAVTATAHDIVATIAFIAMLHLEVSLTVVAAVLGCVLGSLLYRIIIALALEADFLGLQASDLNLITALLVGAALVLPATRARLAAQLAPVR